MFRKTFFGRDLSTLIDSIGRLREEFCEGYRPTVSVALMAGNEVLLVQSTKRLTGEMASWLLPQKGIENGKTVYEAVSRGLKVELDLDFSETQLLALEQNRMFRIVGSYVNEPRSDGAEPKLIVAVAIQVNWLGADIRLNAGNMRYAFINGPHVLWQLMRGTRQRKVVGILETIEAAHRSGLIGWSCRDVLDTVLENGVAA